MKEAEKHLQQTVKQKGSQVNRQVSAQCTRHGSALEIAKSPPNCFPILHMNKADQAGPFPAQSWLSSIAINHINLRKHIQKDSCPCFQFGEEQRSFALLP